MINDNKILCRYSPLNDNIIYSSGFLNKLNKVEQSFLLYHEIGHKKDRFFYLILYILLLSSISLFLFRLIFYHKEILYLFISFIIMTITILISVFTYRFLEYRADKYAIKFIHPNFMISVFSKFKSEKYTLFTKIYAILTHPPPSKRIQRAKKKYF